jgi:hypothetical protein
VKYNSGVFADMLTVLESPEPDQSTGRVEFPPILSAVLVPGGVTRPDISGGTRNDSHLCQKSGATANSGTFTSALTTLREGIWRVSGYVQYSLSIVAGITPSWVEMQQGGSLIGYLLHILPHTTITQNGIVSIDNQYTLDRDTLFQLNVGATGVGERQSVDVALHFQRIA